MSATDAGIDVEQTTAGQLCAGHIGSNVQVQTRDGALSGVLDHVEHRADALATHRAVTPTTSVTMRSGASARVPSRAQAHIVRQDRCG